MLISMELFSSSTPHSAEVKTAGAIRLFPISLHDIMVRQLSTETTLSVSVMFLE
jgi:hypothetical protein